MKGWSLVLVLLVAGSFPAAAADPTLTYQFGLSLQGEGEYYRAITEFKRTRFLVDSVDHPLAKLAGFHIGRSYLLGESYDEAIREFEGFALTYPEDRLTLRSRALLGRAHLELDEYDAARSVFLEALAKTSDNVETFEVRRDLQEELGWSYLEEFRIDLAEESFLELRDLDPDNPRIAALVDRLPDGRRLRRKSPALAGVLSGVLPGAGQAYVGNWADGAVAFFVNGLFIWGTVAAFEDGNDEVGAVLSFIELGWYGGNIFGAVNAAQRFNRSQRETFIHDLRQDFRLGPEDL